MLFSQGVRLDDLGVPTLDGAPVETDGRKIWRRFAENYYLFRGTPTRLWLDYVLSDLFGIDEPLTAKTADAHYDRSPRCSKRMPTAHARCSSVSTSRRSPPPRARSTI